MVDETINDAKDHIQRHAEECIRFVRDAPTVSEMRERLRVIIVENAKALMDLRNHAHMCNAHHDTVVMSILNMELLLFPLATNPATGESFSTFKERVVRCIQRERDGMIQRAADPSNRESAIQFVSAIRSLETMFATEEAKHAQKH